MRFAMNIVLKGACLVPATLAAAEVQATRTAVVRAVAAVESTMDGWFKKRECTSCHHSVLPALALAEARAHGVAIREDADQDGSTAVSAAALSEHASVVSQARKYGNIHAESTLKKAGATR
jgi:hypothetical protein